MNPCILLTGDDPVLLANARVSLVDELVGDGDSSLMLAELAGDDYEMRELVDAAQTAPFLTDRRVVVGCNMGRFKAGEVQPLVDYLADPLDTTVLVLEWNGTTGGPKALRDAVKACGGDIRATGTGRKIGDWVAEQLADAGVKTDRDATRRLVDWVGDDGGKLPGVIAVLVSTYGAGAKLSLADVEPFLGEAGGVPPWELTDAIDRGDIPGALTAVTRMLGAGRHPLQVMATLHTHFQRILRLDGAAVAGEQEAATYLGMKGKSTYPAKKALAQSRRLGSENVRRSIRLLADADLELRGTVDWPEELTMEVLVARLAHLARTSA